MPKDTTGITGAVQDLVTQDERAPIFDNQPQIVEGQTEITDALQEMLDIIEESRISTLKNESSKRAGGDASPALL